MASRQKYRRVTTGTDLNGRERTRTTRARNVCKCPLSCHSAKHGGESSPARQRHFNLALFQTTIDFSSRLGKCKVHCLRLFAFVASGAFRTHRRPGFAGGYAVASRQKYRRVTTGTDLNGRERTRTTRARNVCKCPLSCHSAKHGGGSSPARQRHFILALFQTTIDFSSRLGK